jgi:hypothetical protein
MDDDSTLGGLSPLMAILIVLAFAALGGLLFGTAGMRRNRDPRPADGTPAGVPPARRRRSRTWRATLWTMRSIARSLT